MKRFLLSLQNQCENIPTDELRSMADQIDPDIGAILFYSFIHQASFEVVEKRAARSGDAVPVSRRTFYRKRERYIEDIKQKIAVTARQ